MTMARPSRGQARGPARRSPAWRRRRCRGSARRAAGRAGRSRATCRSRPSAGCRRRASRRPARCRCSGRRGGATASPATRASRRAPSGCRSGTRRPSDGSVTLSRIEASRCRPMALRSSVTSAMPRRRASPRRGDGDRRAVDADLAAASGRALAPKSVSSSSVRPEPSRPAMPRTSPARTSKLDAVEDALPAVRGWARRARGRGPRAPARRRRGPPDVGGRERLAPDHRGDHPVAARSRRSAR